MKDDAASPPTERYPESSGGHVADEVRKSANGVFTWQESQSLSPSLWQNWQTPSFELKFLLNEDRAQALETWALEHLRLDPHGDPERDHVYRTHGLYFDTLQRDVYRRSPGYKRKKFRLRRYGSAPQIFLEQKRKAGDRVAKRRTLVSTSELDRLHGQYVDPGWAGHWFQHRLTLRKLQPSCQITYDRKAFFGMCDDGPMRLTLDRQVVCRLSDQWTAEEVVSGLSLLAGQVLLELKFHSHLPALFKGLVQRFALTPRPISKYRLALEAWGPDAAAGSVAHA